MIRQIEKFKPPLSIRNCHVQTIYPAIFRSVTVEYTRERLSTPDNDFIDIDWAKLNVPAKKLVVLLHGFEGDADTYYVKAIIRELQKEGWDGCSMNYRGCSGEANLQLASYHSGKTDDVDLVIQHITQNYDYETIAMVGISMGGNMTLKYFGEMGDKLHPSLKAAVAFSTPTDMFSCAQHLDLSKNWLYRQRFMRRLKAKVKRKKDLFEEAGYEVDNILNSNHFRDFDQLVTARFFGFDDAHDYWKKSSSKQFIPNIKRPTLLINAADDPFLTPECHPFEEAKENAYFDLAVSDFGGHVGFWDFDTFYMEKWTFDYLTKYLQL